jgi:inner membrane protein
MMTLTHLAISGLMTSLILGSAEPITVSVGAIAGLLPDVDISKSPAGRVLFPISRYLEQKFPHRSGTHSILASLVIAAVVYGLAYSSTIPWQLAHAISIGYTFGYLADLTTKAGIQLFFPATLRCVVPGNRKLRLSTGSNWEYGILVLVVAVLLLVLNINLHGGIGLTFNEILATPRGIQELMNKQGNTHQIVAHIKGVRIFDRAIVNQDFAIIEQRDANTFIVRSLPTPHSPLFTERSELYQVSSRPEVEHQILSERITGKVGQPISTKVESLAWVDEEILPTLNRLLDRYPQAQMYVTGVVDIDEPEYVNPQPQPQQLATAVRRGKKVEFNCCPIADAIALMGEQWGTGQVRVRVVD